MASALVRRCVEVRVTGVELDQAKIGILRDLMILRFPPFVREAIGHQGGCDEFP